MRDGCGSSGVSCLLSWCWRVCARLRLPFRMVLSCESGTTERKPQVEQYGLDELAASAEAVLAGLGPLVAGLAGLAVEACGAGTLDAMEVLVAGRGRELLRGLVQLALDTQAEREVRLPGVTGEDGVRRARAEPGHGRTVVTLLGAVRVRRIGYRSGVRGVLSLFPRDAVLNLPPCGYSWALQRLAEMFCRSVSYEQGHEFVLAATGVSIGRRQLEQITIAAAADAERFYRDRDQAAVPAAGEQEQEQGLPPLAISADGKGVAMLPEPGRAKQDRPRAENRWYACDITAGRDVTIGKVFAEADRRDPGHLRTWIALADGDNYQLGLIQAAAAARGITLAVVIDFIHVLEYLWKAAWCFHPPRDPAMEDWVTAQALDILHGRTADVIARITRLAAEHPPRPGGEHAKIIRKTLSYLQNKQAFMDYPRALANGWPIATGVIEGACRHLVQDRMGITGARWGLQGAQAILWLRAIAASGDTDTYWTWHIAQEHQRNHLSRYQDNLELAA